MAQASACAIPQDGRPVPESVKSASIKQTFAYSQAKTTLRVPRLRRLFEGGSWGAPSSHSTIVTPLPINMNLSIHNHGNIFSPLQKLHHPSALASHLHPSRFGLRILLQPAVTSCDNEVTHPLVDSS